MLRLRELTQAGPGENGDHGPRHGAGRHHVPPRPPEGWPEEVRNLLARSAQEAAALRSERQALRQRVGELESALGTAKASIRRLRDRIGELEQERSTRPAPDRPTDGQWLEGAADRTAHALRSGQDAARGLVERARQRASEIERAALEEAAEVRKRVDAEAQHILRVAHYDAEGILQGAQASGEELLAHARQSRERSLAHARERREALQQDIDKLEARRLALLETYAAIKGSVDDAVRALDGRSRPAAGPQAVLARWLGDTRRSRQPEPGAPSGATRPARSGS